MNTYTNEQIEKIARNINAFDVDFKYSDDRKEYRFWSDLKSKLRSILSNLSEEQKEEIVSLIDADKVNYFGLSSAPVQATVEEMPKAPKGFRKTVFIQAHKLVSSTGISFSEALKKAWWLFRLSKQKIVRFRYKTESWYKIVTASDFKLFGSSMLSFFDFEENATIIIETDKFNETVL